MATSSGILQSYLNDVLQSKGELRPAELLKHNRQHKGGDFLTPLSFYLGILTNTDSVMITYMSEKQQDQLKHDLKIAALLLAAQKTYEFQHQKTEHEKTYSEHLKKCNELLDCLDPAYQARIKKAPEQGHGTKGNPVKYCGILLAEEFAEQLVAMADRKSKTIRDLMDALNAKRLYWVWGSSFLKTVLSLVPEDFFNSKTAGEVVKTPDPYTGTLSWTLYYFRFSLNLFLLLKHVIKGPWMEQEEKDETFTERWQTQWDQRKFTLLNDSIWGTANLLCFFWLTGKTILGSWGDLVTLGLLVFDVSVALWEFSEQQTQYMKQIEQFEKDIATLKATHAQLQQEVQDAVEEKTKKEKALMAYQIEMQLDALKRERDQCKRDWELQKLSLYNSIGYAVSLTIAFVILTMPFLPVSAGAGLALGVAGAVLCFALTVINNAIKGGITLYKEKEALKEVRQGFVEHVNMLKGMMKNPDLDLNSNEAKLLFLEIKKLDATTEHQRMVVALQTATLIRSILIEALVPAIMFASFVFLPLGISLGALGGVLALAMATHVLINQLFQPNEKIKELPKFDEGEYNEFCDLLKSKGDDTKAQHTFFAQKRDAAAKRKALEKLSEDKDYSADGCCL